MGIELCQISFDDPSDILGNSSSFSVNLVFDKSSETSNFSLKNFEVIFKKE